MNNLMPCGLDDDRIRFDADEPEAASKVKTCGKCGETKQTTEFYKNKRDGFQFWCKACAKIAIAVYRATNTEKIKTRNDAWYAENKEKANAACAAWRAANRDKASAYFAKCRADDPGKFRERRSKWDAENPESRRIRDQNRRARKREAGGKLSKGLAQRLFKLQRGKCACGCKQALGTDYHLDHIMPLVLGGSNADDNMQLLTSMCNQQKHAKHPIDFMQSRGFLL